MSHPKTDCQLIADQTERHELLVTELLLGDEF